MSNNRCDYNNDAAAAFPARLSVTIIFLIFGNYQSILNLNNDNYQLVSLSINTLSSYVYICVLLTGNDYVDYYDKVIQVIGTLMNLMSKDA